LSEYLSCGLPVVLNAGIGDSDTLISREKIGTLVTKFNAAEYAKAAQLLAQLAAAPEEIRGRAREVAERCFDLRSVGVERYARLYESVLGVRAPASALSAQGEP
jgi:glycosyltransferase involved in cell wall biosynthesis